MSFDELSAVSNNLVTLECGSGFDFDTSIFDPAVLVFPCLENVVVEAKKYSDLQLILTILDNSIPQGRGCLKKLQLRYSPSTTSDDNTFVDHGLLTTSLINAIEV
jgi:hypothetical protein